jgi:alpha-ketoglutarate-dependent taurine dioxygenase
MIAKVQPSKQKSRSSFKRLLNYLTKEADPETGETLLRGEAVLSNNLVGIDTAAAEMKAVESLNPRCDDAVCHYELAWPPGERPLAHNGLMLRNTPWTNLATRTTNTLLSPTTTRSISIFTLC